MGGRRYGPCQRPSADYCPRSRARAKSREVPRKHAGGKAIAIFATATDVAQPPQSEAHLAV
eukprot:255624-Alexandrium_andersonii.AAC.1